MFLSPEVRELYDTLEKCPKNNSFRFIDVSTCVFDRQILSEQIEALLFQESESEDFYFKALRAISPIFHESHRFLQGSKIHDLSSLFWLADPSIVSGTYDQGI